MEEAKLDKLLQLLMIHGRKMFWNKIYAKWKKNDLGKNQSLLIHAYNQVDLLKKIFLHYIIPDLFTEKETVICIIASFFSDIGKELPKFQYGVIEGREEKELFDHITEDIVLKIKAHLKVIKDDLIPLLKEFNVDISDSKWEEFQKLIISNVFFHQLNTAKKLIEVSARYGARTKESNLIDYIDDLASAKSVVEAYSVAKKIDSINHLIVPLEFAYHKIAKFRGILSIFLNETLITWFQQNKFEPLLFFPEGTLYIRRKNQSIATPSLQEVKTFFKEKITEFLKREDIIENAYQAAFGTMAARVIKGPSLLNEKIIEKKIKIEINKAEGNLEDSRDKIRKKKTVSKDRTIGELIDEKAKEYEIPADTFEENLARFRNASGFFFALLDEFRQWINLFQDSTEKAQMNAELDSIIFTRYNPIMLQKGQRGSAGTANWENIVPFLIEIFQGKNKDLSGLTDRTYIERISERMITTLNDCFKLVKKYQPKLIEDHVLDDLILDVITPKFIPLEGQIKKAQDLSSFYQESKTNFRTMTCFFCGNSDTEPAIAGLIGDGSEKFSNQLEGGKTLGSSNKAYVCRLCKMESILRYLSLGKIPKECILIAPEMNMGLELKKKWASEIKLFIQAQNSALSVLNDKTLAQTYELIAISGAPTMSSLDGKYLIDNAILGKEKLSRMKIAFEKDYDNKIDDFNVVFNKSYRNFEEVVIDIYHGNLWDDSFKNQIPPSTQMNFLYETPSYILILAQYPIGSNDPKSQAYLRKMQISLLLSIIFSGRVKLIDSLNPIFPNELENMIEIPKTPLSNQLLTRLIKTTIVSLHNRMELLQKICVLTTLEQNIGEKAESDFLLKYIKESRGRILNKLVQTMEKTPTPKLITLLNQLPENQDKII